MSTNFYLSSGADADGFGYIEQPAKKRWALETGWTTVRTWWGPRSNEDSFILTKGFNSLAGIDIEYDGDIAKIGLTLVTVANDQYGDTHGEQKDPYFVGWTLSGNSIQAEIAAMSGFGVLNPSGSSDATTLGFKLHDQILREQRKWKADIDDAIAARTYPLKTDSSAFNVYDYMNRIVDASNLHRQARARYLFLQQINKNDHFETSQPVLRKVQTLRSISAVKAEVSYVNRFFSWGALKVHEPTLSTAIIVSVDSLDAADTLYSFQWRKRMPTLEISNDGKRMVTQEYWAYEAYDSFMYGGKITNAGSALIVPTFPDFGAGTDPFLVYNTLT